MNKLLECGKVNLKLYYRNKMILGVAVILLLVLPLFGLNFFFQLLLGISSSLVHISLHVIVGNFVL